MSAQVNPEFEFSAGVEGCRRSRLLDAQEVSHPGMKLRVDGADVPFVAGQTVASALLSAGHYPLRHNAVGGDKRGAFCLMGSCQECAIRIDGQIGLACQTRARDGMIVSLIGPRS